MLFGSRVGFSGTAELMVQLSNLKNPRWRYTRTVVARNLCISWAVLYFTADEKSEIITNCVLTKVVSMLKNEGMLICTFRLNG